MSMITYTFSRREKALVIFAICLIIFGAWYFLVYQGTAEKIKELNNEIGSVQTEVTTLGAKAKKMTKMEEAIAEMKASGAVQKTVPNYDNTSFLIVELNNIMSQAVSYSLSFEDVDMDASDEYALRTVVITYSTNNFAEAEDVIRDLKSGRYPCRIDSVSITDGTSTSKTRTFKTGAAGVTSTVRATFFEKKV